MCTRGQRDCIRHRRRWPSTRQVGRVRGPSPAEPPALQNCEGVLGVQVGKSGTLRCGHPGRVSSPRLRACPSFPRPQRGRPSTLLLLALCSLPTASHPGPAQCVQSPHCSPSGVTAPDRSPTPPSCVLGVRGLRSRTPCITPSQGPTLACVSAPYHAHKAGAEEGLPFTNT